MKHSDTQRMKFFPWLGTTILDSIIKFGKWLFNFLMLFVKAFINIFIYAYKGIIYIAKAIGKLFKNYVTRFIQGDYKTRLSYLFMGSGHIFNGQVVKGIAYFVIQVLFIVFMILPKGGIYWLDEMNIFGSGSPDGIAWIGDTPYRYLYTTIYQFGIPFSTRVTGGNASNSVIVMLYGLATIILTVAFTAVYISNVNGAWKLQNLNKEGKHIATFKEDVRSLLNEKFHVTVLSLPSVTVFAFTILPLIFMILLAFTNYDGDHIYPRYRFAWTGLDTFIKLFSTETGWGGAMQSIFSWTIVWAIFATFSNYIGGMILALLINKKGIKLKKLWRTLFVISIAIPQFITLLIVSKLLAPDGAMLNFLKDIGLIDNATTNIFGKVNSARISVILINMWIGVPYTMLITSGILMNIPEDLYESAKIDGVSAWTQFWSITLPYMLFVTGPYLITQFIGNINNFNVIFFLTGGGPDVNVAGINYGKTDLLVTWLYDLTVGGTDKEYAMGSAIGIIVFLVSAFISIVFYGQTSAAKDEEQFQ
ncbi:MAG: sugar ABC transporter permease [Bacilli bacterium]|nr:sugar ABC transporter permease [Bacilli bacterium]MDD4345057.1 sugar ABC transporter permease [Bacilli bacterium]